MTTSKLLVTAAAALFLPLVACSQEDPNTIVNDQEQPGEQTGSPSVNRRSSSSQTNRRRTRTSAVRVSSWTVSFRLLGSAVPSSSRRTTSDYSVESIG